MKPLSFYEYLKAVKFQTLFFLGLFVIPFLLILLFKSDEKGLNILLSCSLGATLLIFWIKFNEYKRQLSQIEKSGLENYLLKLEFDIIEDFKKGWGHSIIMVGTFKEYPIQLDISYEKGLFWNKYYVTTTAFVDNNVDKQTLKEQQKIFTKQEIDIFPNQAWHLRQINLNQDCPYELETVLTDLIVKLKFNNIQPYKM